MGSRDEDKFGNGPAYGPRRDQQFPEKCSNCANLGHSRGFTREEKPHKKSFRSFDTAFSRIIQPYLLQAIFAGMASNQRSLSGSDVAKNQLEESKTPPTVQQLPFPRRLPVPCRLDRKYPAISA